jgi:acyl carrier protein
MDPDPGPQSSEVVLRDYLPLPEPYAAPRTLSEQRLEEIWRLALTMDRVGIHDSYRDLGMDSLTAATIFALIESGLGVTLPISSLLEAPTIAKLAARIDLATPQAPASGA